MPQALMSKLNIKTVGILVLFCVIFLLTRVPRLADDTVNPDAVNWHERTQQFVNGLKYRQWEKTYQHYHPGVTLMWITGTSTELFKQLSGVKTYTIYTFPAFDFISKLAIVVAQLVVSLYIVFVLRKYLGMFGAVLLVSLFTFEPFFVGNSRLYHLDVLFALLTFAGLLTGFLAWQRQSLVYFLCTGVLLAMAFLTKSIGVLTIGYYLLWLALQAVQSKKLKYIGYTVIVAVTIVVVSFALFPALWVKPIYYLTEIFSESERVGLRRGHEQIVFGDSTDEANGLFYILVLLVKTSPVLLAGVIMSVFYLYRLKRKYLEQLNAGFIAYLLTFAFLYVLFMSLASKKIDRYITLIYPFIAVASYYGYLALSKIEYFRRILLLMVALFIVYPLITFYPYYFLYTNPLMGTTANANQIIGQKPFGIAVYDLKAFINKKYGDVAIGMFDPKPMKVIYGNSKVFDIRINGGSDYDLIVLGINEQLPEKLVNSQYGFKEDSALEINGLKYWRIYAKQRH